MFPLTPEAKSALIERINQGMVSGVPFNTALGLRLLDLDEGEATLIVPWRPDLVGNPETGVLHGGVITSLIDAGCGMAVFLKLRRMTRIVTLDLRIDYLKPATPPEAVRARCECHKLTRQIGFTRAIAFHEDPADPIASAAGTFLIFDEGPSVISRAIQSP